MNSSTLKDQQAITIEISPADGESFRYLLRKEASVIVGCSSTCGVRLQGKGVEDLHCMLVYSDGQLSVRDWHTGSTELNGEMVSDQAELSSGDEIKIGEHRLVIQNYAEPFSAERTGAEEVAGKLDSVDVLSPSGELAVEVQVSESELALGSVDVEQADSEVQEVSASKSSDVEDCTLEGFDFDFDAEPGPMLDDDCEDDEADLLAEVERLRMDLAQRDAELLSLRNSDEGKPQVDDETTERLVNRLEELLDELKGADDRVLELEQLLRLSDEANQAERDEREQLESWVREIEQRISQRESEAEAERERLQSQLDDSREQLELAELQVRRVLNSDSAEVADSSLVDELRQKNEQLESRLESLSREALALTDRLENSTELESALGKIQQLEEVIMKLEVETSRERAELARESAELRRTQDELERQMRECEMSDSDTRLVAMREHLRERYEQEKAERESRRSRSLGGRISRLLTGSNR